MYTSCRLLKWSTVSRTTLYRLNFVNGSTVLHSIPLIFLLSGSKVKIKCADFLFDLFSQLIYVII